jgi:hypothetical protein
MQLAKGDMVVPNPANTAVIRAGELTDRATYFRIRTRLSRRNHRG